MIDFRYHLVSLVSVFLALAVGVVLGAGPLREPIAEGLNSQVEELRESRTQLRDQLATAQDSVGNRDSFLTALQPGLVRGQLTGRDVVLVALPDADNDLVAPLTEAMTAAGAEVTGRVTVQDAWVDPAAAEDRRAALARLRTSVPGVAAGTDDAQVVAALAALLTRAVVTAEPAQSGQADAVARTVLDGLADAGLVGVEGTFTGRGTGAVVLAPGVEQTTTATPSPSVTAAAPDWRSLAAALDTGADGTVVVGPASAAGTAGVLAGLRSAPELSRLVTTVDTGGTPMGTLTTVVALREQLAGGAGAYGFAQGASAPLPPGDPAPAAGREPS